jgi:hypothetical protein
MSVASTGFSKSMVTSVMLCPEKVKKIKKKKKKEKKRKSRKKG